MKILFVSTTPLEYSSSANVRNIALISGLCELGHEVSTLSASPESNSSYLDTTLFDIDIKNKHYIQLGKIHSKFTSKSESKSAFKRYLSFIKKTAYKYYTSYTIYDPRKNVALLGLDEKISEKYDLIISSSDPKSSHLLAESIILSNPSICKRWIQYWGDPFTFDINRKSKLPNRIIEKEELRLLEKADKIIYVSPLTLQIQKSIFKQVSDKMYFLPIPFKKPNYYESTYNEQYVVGYFGDYYSKDRNILPLLDAIDNTDVNGVIFGNSDILISSTKEIIVRPRQPYQSILEYEAKCDLLVCVCNKYGTQIPGKIYHYASTNKPVLIIMDGDLKSELRMYFESFNRFYVCENNSKSIIQALKDIRKENKIFQPLSKFNSKNIAKSFIEL